MNTIPETDVLNACRALFGPNIELTRQFLLSLQPAVAKSAYRKKAKETHPDLFHGKDPDLQKKQSDLFRTLSDSYVIIEVFFKQRDHVRQLAAQREARTRPQGKQRTPEAGSPEQRSGSSRFPFYNGDIPSYHLEIGRYLYFRGVITYQDLIKALSWQRLQRPVLGDIGLKWGWFDRVSIRSILDFRGQPLLFGERAIHLGIITPFQSKLLLAYQRTKQQRLGTFFVEQGTVDPEEMERLAADLKKHNFRVDLHRIRTESGISVSWEGLRSEHG